MLPVTQPVVVARATDAWLLAPAIGAHTVAWLRVPEAALGPRSATMRAGDALVIRRGGKAAAVASGGCATPGDCFTLRAPNPAAADAVVWAAAPTPDAAYVSVSVPGQPLPRTLDVREGVTPPRDETPYVAAGGQLAAWVEGGAIWVRPVDGSAPAVRWVAPGSTLGDVIGIATAGGAIAWTARDADGVFHVRVKTAARRPASEALTARGAGVVLGHPALGVDGTVVIARRITGPHRWTKDEVVALPPGGGDARHVMWSSGTPPGRPLVRPAISGTLVVARVSTGSRGALDAIRVVDLGSGGWADVVRVRRSVEVLSDADVIGTRVVWAQSALAPGGVRASTVRTARVTLPAPPPA